jgi:hypothetical protein
MFRGAVVFVRPLNTHCHPYPNFWAYFFLNACFSAFSRVMLPGYGLIFDFHKEAQNVF